jgi:hypothetical protein
MATNDTTDSEGRRTGSRRRTVLRTVGPGVVLGGSLTGVAAGRPGGAKRRGKGKKEEANGKSKTAGRPILVVSQPSCETLRVEYVWGNPPLEVVVDGPETRSTRLDNADWLVEWAVEPGVYEATATPGDGGSNGKAAVVVEGSPITVGRCPRDVTAAFRCSASDGIPTGTYTLSNPRDADVSVDLVLRSDDKTLAFEYIVPAGSTITVPPSGSSSPTAPGPTSSRPHWTTTGRRRCR